MTRTTRQMCLVTRFCGRVVVAIVVNRGIGVLANLRRVRYRQTPVGRSTHSDDV